MVVDLFLRAFAVLAASVLVLVPTFNFSSYVSSLSGVESVLVTPVTWANYFFPVALAFQLLAVAWGLRVVRIVWAYSRFALRVGYLRV